MMDMNKVLILTGGYVDIQWAKEWLADKKFDYCIAADRGLMYADRLGLDIDFLLGDYDSVDERVLERYKKKVDFEVYPCEKDYTDTHLAIMTAVQKGASDIYILGAIGTRMDHTMTNIGNMKAALDSGVNCHIVDKYNCIYLVNNDTGFKCSEEDTAIAVGIRKNSSANTEISKIIDGISVEQRNELMMKMVELAPEE